MNDKQFHKAAGVVFFIIAFFHLLRAIYEWPAVMGGIDVPIWASWVAVIIAGYLGWRGLVLAKSR